MTDFETILSKSTRLLDQETPPAGELRRLSVELDDLINSPEYQNLTPEDHSQVQKLLQNLRSRIRGGEQTAVPLPNHMPLVQETASNGSAPAAPRNEERQHNSYAQESMEEAEKLFYSGHYSDAIKVYDQVLTIEPDWERAKQHRIEAEGYLRTGHIPAVALPAEAATAFSKAQSAARLGRFQDAMGMLMRAQNILQQFGIQRWQEGQEFEQKLQQNIDAENVYNEGMQLFSQGQLDEGIDKVDTAAQVTGLPRYGERLQTLLKERDQIENNIEALSAPMLEPKTVSQARSILDGLVLKYGLNPTLQRLKSQVEAAIPRVVAPLKDQIQALKTQAARAQTIESARNRAQQARQLIDTVRSQGYWDEEMDRLQNEVDKLLQDQTRYSDQLEQARTVLEANRSWPSAAARMSVDLRTRYPNDPDVVELNRSLGRYNNSILGIKILSGILGAALIIFLLWLGFRQVRASILAMAPTPTPTMTATATGTATPRPSLTPSLTPTLTSTPTVTPTPLTAIVARKIWLHTGCYEEFNAMVQIPMGASVNLLPAERRFDSLARECLLVEYHGPTQTSIGWMLISDLR
jgi:tetratricopeptide (TPR) repeat protein